MKVIKNIIMLSIVLIFNILTTFADTTIRDGLLKQDNTIINNVDFVDKDLSMVDLILTYIKDSLSGLLLVTVVGVFIYIGMKLVMARGNPEEFKKAMMHFVYVAVGMFIVSAAYAIVRLVTGISF